MNALAEILFHCASCDYARRTYFPQCPQCRQWNQARALESGRDGRPLSAVPAAVPLSSYAGVTVHRLRSGIPQLDEALGGGFVLGTSTIFVGEKKCGKTTLALQAAFWCAVEGNRRALYLSNEQSAPEILAQVQRLKLGPDLISFGNPADFRSIREYVKKYGVPSLLVVDSVQQFYDSEGRGKGKRRSDGEFMALRNWCQKMNVPSILISQVNAAGKIKGGTIYGHEVSAVLRLRQKPGTEIREIYVEGNRNGPAGFSVNMTMTAKGLV